MNWFNLIWGIGLLVIVFSIYPSKVGWSRVLRQDYAPDRSTMEMVLTISRPIMFGVGCLLFGVGFVAVAIIGTH
jgi:hypothetical protein